MDNNHSNQFADDHTRDGSCQHGNDEYEPTPDAQMLGAYFRYIEQGAVDGHDLRHWLETEKRLQEDCRLERRIA